jgi:hypothetical protein
LNQRWLRCSRTPFGLWPRPPGTVVMAPAGPRRCPVPPDYGIFWISDFGAVCGCLAGDHTVSWRGRYSSMGIEIWLFGSVWFRRSFRVAGQFPSQKIAILSPSLVALHLLSPLLTGGGRGCCAWQSEPKGGDGGIGGSPEMCWHGERQDHLACNKKIACNTKISISMGVCHAAS